MKKTFSTIALLTVLTAAGVTYAQQPAGRPRRGLDQIDLLTVTPRSTPVETVSIDLTSYSLLGPLIEHSREFEREYNNPLTGAERNLTQREYYGAFYRKANDVQASIYMIKGMAPLSVTADSVLNQNIEIIGDVLNVLAALRASGTGMYSKEISKLNDKYGQETTTNPESDARLLVSVMIRRINTNFSKFRVAA